MTRDYSAMMNAAFELGSFTGYLTSEDEKAQSKVQQAFDAARNVFVYDILKTEITGDEAKQLVHADLGEMEQLQPEWGNIYGYVRQELYDRIDSESDKSPLLRKVVRWTPLALGIVALIVYFGIRFTSGVDVSAPLESKSGLQQRAAAAEKVITYDEWAGTRTRRGGFLKGVLLWPIEPTEAEVRGASEFAMMVVQSEIRLSQQGWLCPSIAARNPNDPEFSLTDREVEATKVVAKQIESGDIVWMTPPAVSLDELVKDAAQCASEEKLERSIQAIRDLQESTKP